MPPNPFNLTLSSQSPLIRYTPSRDGPSASTWNIIYEDTPWTNSTEVIGRGNSLHTSSLAGATASLGWVGTDIFVYGSLQQGAEITADVDGSTDGVVLNLSDGLLLVRKDMAYGWHEVRVKVDRGEVSLTGVTLTVGVGSSGSTIQNTTVSSVRGSNSINTQDFETQFGDWTLGTSMGGGGGTQADTWLRIDSKTSQAKLVMIPPANVSYAFLYGSVNFNHGPYSVSLFCTSSSAPTISTDNTTSGLDKSALSTTSGRGETVVTPTVMGFDGLSSFIGIDEVSYMAALDPRERYEIMVENRGIGSQYWDISKAVYLQGVRGDPLADDALPVSSSTGLSKGAMAGIAVGAVAAVAALLALVFFWLRRRKGRHTRGQTGFEVDHYSERSHDETATVQTRPASSQPGGYESLLAGSHLSHGSIVHSPSASSAYRDDFQTPNPYPATSTSGSSRPASQMYLSNPSENEPEHDHTLPPDAARGPRKKRNSQVLSPGLRQELDGGRVEMEVIPPEYDPTWAQGQGLQLRSV